MSVELEQLHFNGRALHEMRIDDLRRVYWYCMRERNRSAKHRDLLVMGMSYQQWMNSIIQYIIIKYVPDELYPEWQKHKAVAAINHCNRSNTSWYGMTLWYRLAYKDMAWWIKSFLSSKKSQI